MGDRAAAAVRGLGGTPFEGFALPLVADGTCIWDMGCVGWETFRSRLSLYCWDGGTGCSSRSLGGDERERKRLPKKLLFFSLSWLFENGQGNGSVSASLPGRTSILPNFANRSGLEANVIFDFRGK